MATKIQGPVTLTVEKDGKLEITGRSDVGLSGLTETEVLVDPRPIRLKVSTDTDFPAVWATASVGIGGILTALVVAWFTHRSGKQAAAAKAAELRNDWMNKLRIEAADFFAATIDIAIVMQRAKEGARGDFMGSTEDHELFTKFLKHRAVIGMMFDKNNSKFKQVLHQVDAISDAVGAAMEKKDSADHSIVNTAAKAFLLEMGTVLELAWQDIKDDLYRGAKKSQSAAV
jgi:hypothetical protein